MTATTTGAPRFPLFLLLLLPAVVFVALVGLSRRRRRAPGLGRGRIEAADDSRLGSPTLRSDRLGLAGRCDHLLRVGGTPVPVEHKPSALRLHPSHVLQVGALCPLVADVYGVRPPYGVVVLAGGAQDSRAGKTR